MFYFLYIYMKLLFVKLIILYMCLKCVNLFFLLSIVLNIYIPLRLNVYYNLYYSM
ncbi:hypothetical protein C0J52_05533 [Blattella germanica]|nr:hypothetical protein C0J52_05533 [Blattella germanica]